MHVKCEWLVYSYGILTITSFNMNSILGIYSKFMYSLDQKKKGISSTGRATVLHTVG